jgi:hypothetical protein
MQNSSENLLFCADTVFTYLLAGGVPCLSTVLYLQGDAFASHILTHDNNHMRDSHLGERLRGSALEPEALHVTTLVTATPCPDVCRPPPPPSLLRTKTQYALLRWYEWAGLQERNRGELYYYSSTGALKIVSSIQNHCIAVYLTTLSEAQSVQRRMIG